MKKALFFVTGVMLVAFAALSFAGIDAKGIDIAKKKLLDKVTGTIDSEDDILSAIPDLKSDKDKAGNRVYIYRGVRLEALDLDTLKSLSDRVVRESNRNQVQRINGQLDQIRMMRDMQSNSDQLRQIQKLNSNTAAQVAPVRPPEAPSVTKAPQTAPAAPVVPSRR